LSDIQGEMIQKADENLYRAKRSGRNSVCSGSEEDDPKKANAK
jgi:PleD family two-component response regulator